MARALGLAQRPLGAQAPAQERRGDGRADQRPDYQHHDLHGTEELLSPVGRHGGAVAGARSALVAQPVERQVEDPADRSASALRVFAIGLTIWSASSKVASARTTAGPLRTRTAARRPGRSRRGSWRRTRRRAPCGRGAHRRARAWSRGSRRSGEARRAAPPTAGARRGRAADRHSTVELVEVDGLEQVLARSGSCGRACRCRRRRAGRSPRARSRRRPPRTPRARRRSAASWLRSASARLGRRAGREVGGGFGGWPWCEGA